MASFYNTSYSSQVCFKVLLFVTVGLCVVQRVINSLVVVCPTLLGFTTHCHES